MNYRLNYDFLKIEFRSFFECIDNVKKEKSCEYACKALIRLIQDIVRIIFLQKNLFYNGEESVCENMKLLVKKDIMPYGLMHMIEEYMRDIEAFLESANTVNLSTIQSDTILEQSECIYDLCVWLVINLGEEDYSLFYDKLNVVEKAVFDKYLLNENIELLPTDEESIEELLEESEEETEDEDESPGTEYLVEGELHYLGKDGEKNYYKAREFFQKAADEGNDYAQGYLALFYEKGLGGDKDVDKALYWYKKSALKGNAFSQYSLGYIYFAGDILPRNLEYSFDWYKRAADGGFAPAQYALSYLYKNGQGCEKNIFKAYFWLEEAAENDFEDAYYVLGQSYLEGNYVETDYKKAFFYLSKGADRGDESCLESLGDMYYWGLYVDEDKEKAYELYNKSIEKGNKKLYYKIGKLYEDEEKIDEALEYFLRGHNSGDIRATQKIGLMYYNGEGVRKDIKKSLEYIRLAAEERDSNALYVLGIVTLENDREVGLNYLRESYKEGSPYAAEKLASELLIDVFNERPVDSDEIIEYIKMAIENNISDAIYYYGLAYAYGIGVDKSKEEAFGYFKEAAMKGCEKAMIKLGHWYKYGVYVKEDIKEAIKWYKKAAEDYNTEALINIIEIYEKGIGTLKNPLKAFEGAKLLRESNVVEGNLKLAYYYLKGFGVSQNIKKAQEYIDDTLELDERKTFNFLGEISEEGINGLTEKEAIEFYIKSIEQGYGKAYANLEYLLYKRNEDMNLYEEHFKYIKSKGYPVEYGKSIFVGGMKKLQKAKERNDEFLSMKGINEIRKSIQLGFYEGVLEILEYYNSLEKTEKNLINIYKYNQKKIYYGLDREN